MIKAYGEMIKWTWN